MLLFENWDLKNVLVEYLCIASGEDWTTIFVETTVKEEPFDVEDNPFPSMSSTLLPEMNEVVDEVCNESLREVKLECNEMSDQENEDGMV